jgi:hypothetical protein
VSCLSQQSAEDLRCCETLDFHYCDSPTDGIPMEFRLFYHGPLPAETSRRSNAAVLRMATIKHRIRAALHPQIKEFWQSLPVTKVPGGIFTAKYTEAELSFWEYYSNQHKTVSESNHIHRFAPLITESSYYGCSLDVLFLKRDMPRRIPLIHHGDLDNRMKVLFDALRMPKETQELEDIPQDPSENPCFCLLKDDRFIDHVSITTDRLLTPMQAKESIDDVIIVIHVNAKVVDAELQFRPLQ